MTPNVLISRSEAELETQVGTDFIAHIDGIKAPTLRQFYEQIADVLEIPDPIFTLDMLTDALNDLQWLDEKRIVLYLTNTANLASKERDATKFGTVLSVLDATAEDWKWVDVDDDLSDQKEIIIVLEDNSRIRKLLAQEAIEYRLLADLQRP